MLDLTRIQLPGCWYKIAPSSSPSEPVAGTKAFIPAARLQNEVPPPPVMPVGYRTTHSSVILAHFISLPRAVRHEKIVLSIINKSTGIAY